MADHNPKAEVHSDPKTLVVITGGTIEAGYNPEEGTPYLVPMPASVNESAIPGLIDMQLGRGGEVDYLKLGMTDSKKMAIPGQVEGAKPMIDTILHHAIKGHYDRIVIVQGTDTMPEHAQYLKQLIEEWAPYAPETKNKTFVFTGAMTPLRDKEWNWRDPSVSDGWHNVSRALDDVKTQAPGVYLQMGDSMVHSNGARYEKPGPWEADTVRKHVELTHPDSVVAEVKASGFVAATPEHLPRFQERF